MVDDLNGALDEIRHRHIANLTDEQLQSRIIEAEAHVENAAIHDESDLCSAELRESLKELVAEERRRTAAIQKMIDDAMPGIPRIDYGRGVITGTPCKTCNRFVPECLCPPAHQSSGA